MTHSFPTPLFFSLSPSLSFCPFFPGCLRRRQWQSHRRSPGHCHHGERRDNTHTHTHTHTYITHTHITHTHISHTHTYHTHTTLQFSARSSFLNNPLSFGSARSRHCFCTDPSAPGCVARALASLPFLFILAPFLRRRNAMRLLPRFQLRRLTTPSRTTPTFAGGRCADDQPAGAGTTTQTSASLRPPSLPLTLSSPVSPFAPTLTSIHVACRSTRWGTVPAATILPVLAAARRLFLTLVPVPRSLQPAGPLQRPDGPDRGKAGCPCATRLASTIRLGSPSLPLPRSHASKTSRPSWTVWM